MTRANLVTLAVAAALGALPVAIATPADAQIGIQLGAAPPPQAVPRNGPYGDRDHDGVPNRYDNHNNNRGAWGDRDHDGVPNQFDRQDNRYARDRNHDFDHDGVPNRYDRAPNNPYQR